MDWDPGVDTDSADLPEPEHGWVAADHDPDLSGGRHGPDDGNVLYDEDHYDGDDPIEPLDDEDGDAGGRSHAVPVDTDGDGDYDRLLVDRDGDGDYDRALPYGDDGDGRR